MLLLVTGWLSCDLTFAQDLPAFPKESPAFAARHIRVWRAPTTLEAVLRELHSNRSSDNWSIERVRGT